MARHFIGVLVAALGWTLLMMGGAGAQAPVVYDDLTMHVLSHDGVARRVGVYAPPGALPAGAPLIVALHGRFSSAKAFHALSNLRAVADVYGAVLVYPETDGALWSDTLPATVVMEPARNDAGFIAAAVDWARVQYAVDIERVFVIGYDTGGAMAYRLACEGELRVAAAAIVSAMPWEHTLQSCRPERAVPVLMMHGERDAIFPTAGLAAQGAYTERRLGVRETTDFWRTHNGCAESAAVRGAGRSVLYPDCRAGGAVAFVEVSRGEHDWFRSGPSYRLNRHDVDAASLIGGFFFSPNTFSLPAARGQRNRARSYFVYVPPSYNAAEPMPMLLVLHGRPQSATGIALDTLMNPIAARHGFIVVYPQGLDNEWNSFSDLVGRRAGVQQDDEAFLKDLVEDLGVDLNIDRRRVYITGFSNGGFMTIRLACTSSDHFAGFAAVGAGLYSALTGRCRGRPAPFLLIHGTGDESVPYRGVVQTDGQGGEPTRISLGAQDTVGFFMRRNGCSLRGQSARIAESGRSPGTHVIRFAPYECNAGADVMFYIVNGGAHNWPGSGTGPEPETRDINASDVIWDFLRAYSLAEPPARRDPR